MTASRDSGDDRIDISQNENADAADAPAVQKKSPRTTAASTARKTPARKTGTTATKSGAAKTDAAKTDAVKKAASTTAAAKTAAARRTAAATAAKTAAVKKATATSAATKAAAKTTAAKTASEKAVAAAKQDAASLKPKTTTAKKATKPATAKAPAAKTTATKTTAAKTTAAKSTSSPAKTAATKSATAKASGAKAAATKAASAKAATAKSTTTTPATTPASAKTAQAKPVTKSAAKAAPKTTTSKPGATKTAASKTTASKTAAAQPATEAPVELTVLPEATSSPRLIAASNSAEAPTEARPPRGTPTAAVPTTDAPAPAVITPAVEIADTSLPLDMAPDDSIEPTSTEVRGDAIRIRGLVKRFGDTHAVDGIDLTVPAGSFYGLVGPNGAGKTTTLSIIAGLLRPDAGTVHISGIDQKKNPLGAKRAMGVLPDRLRTFDRLTGRQLLHYNGQLRRLSRAVIDKRVGDLARAFDLTEALGRVVSDYSAGMTKKLMIAGALIHSPRVLVLDEPFEAVDPVSSGVILDILRSYVSHGGTVILSSHGMDLVERVCSRVAVIVDGEVLAEGTIDEVRAGQSLSARFVELSGAGSEVEGLEWLHTFSA